MNAKGQMKLMIELSIYQKVNHPAIIKFYGANFVSFTDPTRFSPSIIIDYYPNGTLRDVIFFEKKYNAGIKFNSTKKCINLIGISHAAKYLHEQGIIHGDLKSDNILLDENYYPKISDFGLSHAFTYPLTNDMEFNQEYIGGTELYMAPELIKGDTMFGPTIDVYAFSICAYELISGKEPCDENFLMSDVLKGERPQFTEDFSEAMVDLISRCWCEDPSERLSTNYKSYFLGDLNEKEISDYIDYLIKY